MDMIRKIIPAAVLLLGLVLASATPAYALNHKYVAHKGNVGNTDVVENSLEAFQYAAKNCPTLYGIETDIFKTSKGDFICCHTDDNGVAKWGSTNISKMTLANIKKVSYRKCHVATLAEFLAACKSGGKVAFIQVSESCGNTDAELTNFVKIVNNAGMLNQCVFTGSMSNAATLGKIKTIAKNKYKVTAVASLGSSSVNKNSKFDEALKLVRTNNLDTIAVYANHTDKLAYAKTTLAKSGNTKYKLRGGGEGVQTELKARNLIDTYGLQSIYTTGFNPKSYTVTFKGNKKGSETIAKKTVGYGDSAKAPTASEISAHTASGYKFVKWSAAFNKVISNITVTAVYKKA